MKPEKEHKKDRPKSDSDESKSKDSKESATKLSEPSSEPQKSAPKAKPSLAKVHNRTNRNIEIDLGRDREIRIPAHSSVMVDRAVLDHPKFKYELPNLLVH